MLNQDYRVIEKTQISVEENQASQPQSKEGLIASRQTDKYKDTGSAANQVQKMLLTGKGSRKNISTGELNASDESSQRSNAQAQSKQKVPKSQN
ncbi:MAG: hypothetical protein EZS28_009710 [Streblomastix strix]|uniref:Uncharacterized protein n=1 Tax=Streblomastix strix TaxID=222440 RepID=A0A5J4WJ54_9EUKA|nr:MAG: hypothetical protein EZS28_009710 [Streblomastix strix]